MIRKLTSYFNTTPITGAELSNATNKVKSQDVVIMTNAWFLVKASEQKNGIYKRLNHCWMRNGYGL